MDTMGDDVEGDDVEGMDVVGEEVGRALALRRALGGRRGLRLPSALAGASTQGISRPKEELDFLPFTLLTMTTLTSGFLEALPQRPFRGERLIANAAYVTAAGVVTDVSNFVVITPALYVGAVQVGASQGATPLSAFSATAFGVRLAMPVAGQGTRIFLPVASNIPIASGDSIIVSATIIGRAVR